MASMHARALAFNAQLGVFRARSLFMWQIGNRAEYHNWSAFGCDVHQVVIHAIDDRVYDTDFGPEYERIFTLVDIDSGEEFYDTNEYMFPID
jgi:hypothetical protein